RRARSRRSRAARVRHGPRGALSGRAQHPVRRYGGSLGAGSGQPGECRSRGADRGCGQEDRGVAGMSEQVLNEHLLSVLRAPHISEKSARLQETSQYVFMVAPRATKQDVKRAVEGLFNVQVLSVNVSNRKG